MIIHNKYKKIIIATAVASALTDITGCVGSNAVTVDYLIFNSLGFWTGTNPLNGKPLANLRIIETGVMTQVDDNTLQMDITYNNGDKAVLTGVKQGQLVTYYIDGVVVSEISMEQLQAFTAS
ncbi:DUF3332 family protein [Moritella marina ATCC 15381]|uniref:DUF3332 family protein n=1 Tax=Moritella marina ATCC 15381 TaxID=1202962 RepID=A0A5J6WKR9_MORMI|nr:DUF3332 family protein [Moritella marina]QFI37831.1 DUF3332 family protein [Moritella marina ATCC 15381]